MINVLITDDHPIVRRGLKQLLEDDKNQRFGILEEAESGKEMLEKLASLDFDVLLLDISLPRRNGLELLVDIKRIKPKLPVIMLSVYSEEQYAVRAIKLGASGYLNKASAPDELISAIFKVSQGSRYLPPSIAEKLADNAFDENKDPLYAKLSVRELEVISLLASGLTLSSIAKELSLSPKTISTYRTRILSKLKLRTTSDIIKFAINEGFANSLM